MATLSVRVNDLAVRVATECKSLRTLINSNMSDLSSLTTIQKSNIVAAVNELKAGVDSLVSAGYAVINDASSSSTSQTWSITKIASEINTALNNLMNGAPAALDQLNELASALGNDANFASTVTNGLSNRVRVDTNVQNLTLLQQSNARTNIDAYGSIEIGNPNTDFVTIFNSGLS